MFVGGLLGCLSVVYWGVEIALQKQLVTFYFFSYSLNLPRGLLSR